MYNLDWASARLLWDHTSVVSLGCGLPSGLNPKNCHIGEVVPFLATYAQPGNQFPSTACMKVFSTKPSVPSGLLGFNLCFPD